MSKNIQMKSLPNALTLARVALCPLTVSQLLAGHYPAAMALFAIACFTDGLDGHLARKLGAVSALGSILDPISDKIYIAAFLSALMTFDLCPPWFLALVLTVSMALGLGWLLTRSPDRVAKVRPLRIGKWNTALQFAWIGVLCASLSLKTRFPSIEGPTQALAGVGYALLGGLQLGVLLKYFMRFRHAILPDTRTTVSA